MGKRDKYGRFIEGVTDIHDREYFERYLKSKNWERCFKWLHAEVCYLHNKVVRARIVYNLFGFLLTAVLTFFTWLFLMIDIPADKLQTYGIANFCNNAYIYLCNTVPGGNVAVIGGLLALPFVASGVIALLLLPFSSKVFYKKINMKSQLTLLTRVKRQLEKLEKLNYQYENDCFIMILYALLGGIATGGAMIYYSGGQETIKYLFIGAVFTVLYGFCLWGIAQLYAIFLCAHGVDSYPTYGWISTVKIELGEYSFHAEEEEPVKIPDPEEEKRIKEFLDGIYADLSGKKYGDY